MAAAVHKEYGERLAEWRPVAAVAREKAGRERAKWEGIRAAEAKRMASATSSFISGWESVGPTTMAGSTASLAASSTQHVEAGSTPSPGDARDLTSNERPGGRGGEVLEEVLGPRPPAEQQRLITLEPFLPKRQPPAPAPARSMTLVLFDPATSTRTRLLALAATLGINFFLPSVNGDMLCFGEMNAIVNCWRPSEAQHDATSSPRGTRGVIFVAI